MKFAHVHGQRRAPEPGLSGDCPACGKPMIARCGEVRVWHWSHKGRRHCDPWWENETEWHRTWKEHFPAERQEMVQHAADGERHIADVKTGDDWIIEFQHSYMKPEERRSREAFYSKLVWVVDGLRRKTDVEGFQRALEQGIQMAANFPGVKVQSDKGALLRDWAGSRAHVFFDFGDEQTLWWLAPNANETWAHVVRVSRADFIGSHLREATKGFSEFDSFGEALSGLVSDYEASRHARLSQGKQRNLARLSRRRRQ